MMRAHWPRRQQSGGDGAGVWQSGGRWGIRKWPKSALALVGRRWAVNAGATMLRQAIAGNAQLSRAIRPVRRRNRAAQRN